MKKKKLTLSQPCVLSTSVLGKNNNIYMSLQKRRKNTNIEKKNNGLSTSEIETPDHILDDVEEGIDWWNGE